MKQQDLINRLRNELAQIVTQTEGNAAMNLTDYNKIAENLICGLMREVFDLRGLKNLNAVQRDNYPAIDLADFDKRTAVQVTATASLQKVKGTIGTFLRHGLDASFDRLIVYVLSRKQNSYSQDSIDKAAGKRLAFDGKADILDYTDLLARAVHLEPAPLAAALRVIEAYNRGVPIGLSEADFDASHDESEEATLNLVECFFPQTLYVADIVPDYLKRPKGMGKGTDREIVRHHGREQGKLLPSDFYVYAKQLLTFHDLNDEDNPFAWAVDAGTIVPLGPKEWYGLGEAEERVFKALLRYTLQEKLYRHRVLWAHAVRLFAFMPYEQDMYRDVTWFGAKRNKRRVYERKMGKKNPEKVLSQKHFAFAVDFYHLEKRWYMSLTPDWFFSYGEDFRASRFAWDKVSWLKRRENNAALDQHFRFLVSWLSALDADDMFSDTKGTISVGSAVSLPGHPALPDDEWLPARTLDEDTETGDLFADREDE